LGALVEVYVVVDVSDSPKLIELSSEEGRSLSLRRRRSLSLGRS